MREQAETIDGYIALSPQETREQLGKIRDTIRSAAPDAEEAIRYGIPTFRLEQTNLVHFAAFRDHLSFFPTASGVEHFQKELEGYAMSKGTIRIPLDGPVPYDLIERITRFRVAEIRQKRDSTRASVRTGKTVTNPGKKTP